jgi:maltose-binding protein MalE
MQAAANHLFSVVPGPMTAAEREQHRLDRLRELRATIDALRNEQTSNDPLLAWVIAQAQSEHPRHS